MFIGRTQELGELERRYGQPGFQFYVMYGRRRVGKTRLIQEFARDKRSIYLMATQENSTQLLANFTAEIKEQFPDPQTEYLDSFPSWNALFRYIGSIAKENRLVFVIDEYPYLAKAEPSIPSILQKHIDSAWRATQLYFILCGSSMSFMEDQVLGYESPLYGRRTAQLKIMPLPYYDCIRFFPGWSDENRLLAYGACGGIPQYLEYFARYSDFRDAVIGEFLMPSGHLQEEPRNLMIQELREPNMYNTILAALAHGATKQNEIASAAERDRSSLTFYLKTLMELGIVSKRIPIGEKNPRRTTYQISDNLYRFWFTFVPKSLGMLTMQTPEAAYDRKIAPALSEYFGHIFEDICLQFILRQVRNGSIAPLYDEGFGFWQGPNPIKKQTEDIDVVLSGTDDLLVGECKWTAEPIDTAILHTLEERGALLRNGRNIAYALFSKNGFTAGVTETAVKRNDILLYDLKKIASING